MKYYTYIHYKADTLEPFYIGYGSDRRIHHTSQRKQSWKDVVAKHGLKKEFAARFETKEEAQEHEKFLIRTFRDLGYNLLNITGGGPGTLGVKQSAEFVERRNGVQRGKERPASTGANNGRFKGTIIGTHRVTGEQLRFNGTKEVVAAGFTWSAVITCVNGKRVHHKNYTWSR